MQQHKYFILAILIILTIPTSKAWAQPPLPSGFYGALTVNGDPVEVGAVVSAWIDGVHYPTDFTVTTEGEYGVLYVSADDPDTPDVKEGGVPGDVVNFRVQINQYILSAQPNGVWQGDGVNQKLDLAANGEVPVELAAFDFILKDNSVELNWSTATETNNHGFEIQRSTDKVTFSTIAFVPGNGTSVIPHIYHFTDSNLKPGKYFYRLKQLDIDGSFCYSQILDVTIQPPSQFELLQNYPNPFNSATQIKYSLAEAGHVSIKIYDMKGQLIRNLVSANQPVGIYTVQWDSKDNDSRCVANGVYVCCMRIGRFALSNKIILLK